MRPRRFHSYQSKRFVERQKYRTATVIGLALVSGVTWLFALSRLTGLPAFAISDVRVNGADPDIAPRLQAAAIGAIGGDYLGLFSRSNTLLYPHAAVTAAVIGSSPRIADIRLSRNGLRGLVIDVVEKNPAAIVCPTLPDLSGTTLSFSPDDRCYFSDDSGYIYKEAPGISGTIYDRYYIPDADQGDSGSIIGSYATSSAGFAALQGFYRGAQAAGIPVLAVLMKDGGDYEMYADQPASAHAGSGPSATSTEENAVVIYFNDARPLTEELSNLVSFWSSFADRTRTNGTAHILDSIDVRYGSNVFYRQSD